MTDSPRYRTLRDYIEVLRRHWLLVTIVVAAFALGAWAYNDRQDKTYTAEAALSLTDPAEENALTGGGGASLETPDQRAAAGAQLATSRAVAIRVRKQLKTRDSAKDLQEKVSARSEPRTNFVKIDADASTARRSATLANAFAEQTATLLTQRKRARYRQAAAAQRRLLRRQRGDKIVSGFTEERISRLEGASRVIRAAAVDDRAEPPDSPSSPDSTRNIVLGILLGLTFGIAAAFVREALDVRLRGSGAIQEELDTPVIGYVGQKALGKSVADSSDGLSPADLESFRILRANVDLLDGERHLRTIMVTSALPEEGKSTVALALASVYAAAGRRVLLVECDLRKPVLAKRLGVSAAPGLTDYLLADAQPKDVLQEITLDHPALVGSFGTNGAGPRPNDVRLVCITAGTPAWGAAELLAGERFQRFLDEVSQAYEIVVIDSSPMLAVADTLEMVSNVDAVLMCVRAGRTTRQQAQAAKAALDRTPPRPTGLVVTGVRRGDEPEYGYYPHARVYGEAGSS